MSGDIEILDKLVTIKDEPFTDVRLYGSTFRRWDPSEIARYYQQKKRWGRWGWTRRWGNRVFSWALDRVGVPVSEPQDRTRVIDSCVFFNGQTAINIASETEFANRK